MPEILGLPARELSLSRLDLRQNAVGAAAQLFELLQAPPALVRTDDPEDLPRRKHGILE
jgi:hypothetical protein